MVGDMADELIEVEESVTLTREEAAAKLRAIADQLSRHNQIEFEKGGLKMSAKVPNEVELSIEVEIGDESEIEIEIKW
jgi:amphi-Trp domain-containing protein